MSPRGGSGLIRGRLFVALDLPVDATAALEQIQPRAVAGLKRIDLDQLHLTLHFLGESDMDQTKLALQSVSVPSFFLTLEGVGQFPTRDGGVLWAGIAQSDPLQNLHRKIADALGSTGFIPETRPFSPHITLARYQPRLDPAVIHEFLARHARFRLADLAMTAFHLYSSTLTPTGPIYRREHSIALLNELP